MPDLVKHREQIVSNEDFFVRINEKDPKFYDWNLTVMFYTILHYSDAFLFLKGYRDIEGYKKRESLIDQFFSKDERAKYRNLKNASVDSRYKVLCLGGQAQHRCIHIHQNIFTPLKQSL
jgi:hypothetical protein